ncbi:MAG: MmgE/PrpD family protein [Anaerolineales bacterium]
MTLNDFIHHLRWEEVPEAARLYARRCLLDTVGAGLGGRRTECSRIIFDFAALNYGGRGAQLWLDGRQVSPPGAALANGMTVDSLDIHDGHKLTKGHAGAALIPALLASLNLNSPNPPISGKELLTTLVIGYEVAIRAGIALHATVCDYHTSGAWNALGCAAMVARRLGSNTEQTRHALGIAEYHGPRSQMMRCIDYPTMLKDGSGWGAMAGVSAALMAQAGFTGAPALTVEDAKVAHVWADLGARLTITEQYFKPYAVCYWAQSPVNGALALQRAHTIPLDDIRRIRVYSFHEAVQLDTTHPANTEEAQYSVPFPVAAALVHGELGPAQLSGEGLRDPRVLGVMKRVELIEDQALSARFPAERIARVVIETTSGALHDSGEVKPKWDTTIAPPDDDALREKFRWLARDVLPEAHAAELETALWECDGLVDANTIVKLLAPRVE